MKRSMSSHRTAVFKAADFWLHGMHHRNHWITVGPLRFYVRKGLIKVGASTVTGVTLANVNFRNPGNEGRGLFRPVLEWMEERLAEKSPVLVFAHQAPLPLQAIAVENVASKRLQDILRRHGWTESVPQDQGLQDLPSFYRL